MIAALLVMAGGGAVAVMPRFLRVEAWRVLRPAEAALRRLVVVVQFVQGIKARYVPRLGRAGAVNVPRGSGQRAAVFALFDRRKCFDLKGLKRVTRGNPRLWMPGMDAPVFVTKTVPMADDMVNAARLFRRLQAVQAALEDLPKQARRLARMQAKRAVAGAGVYIRPMRPGRPPGHRARKRHPVD